MNNMFIKIPVPERLVCEYKHRAEQVRVHMINQRVAAIRKKEHKIKMRKIMKTIR